MSNFNEVGTYYADSFNIDAFGRLRTSELTTQFNGKQLHDNLPLFYDIELEENVTATHSTTNAETELSISAAAINGYAVMQTKQRFNYLTGKSCLGLMTLRNFNQETAITKRVGYFNSNIVAPFNSDLDGFYLEISPSSVDFVISKNGTKNTINQSTWNGDKMDGTGKSGINLDLGTETGNLLFWYQFEWLGVGTVEWGFVVNGAFYTCHKEDHILADGVYMSSPNHSLRYEMRATGTGVTGTFNVICSTFNTEGALNRLGKDGGISDNNTHLDADNTSNFYLAVAIQLDINKIDTLVDVLDAVLFAKTNDNFEYQIVLNPTYSGSVTFNSLTNYAVKYGFGATANTITGSDAILKAGYGSQNSITSLGLETAIRLGAKIDGTVDTIGVIVKPLSSNLDIHRAINWRELS